MTTAAPTSTQHATQPSKASASRIVGLDVARAIALFGMLAAHLGYDPDRYYGYGGWVTPFDGRSAPLFATLAGISLALISRHAHTPTDWARTRIKVATRGVLLLVLGYALVLLDTPLQIILPAYGVMFLMTVPLLRLRSRTLLIPAGTALMVGAPLVLAIRWFTTGDTSAASDWSPYEQVILGYYPALSWIAYVLVGIVAGRVLLTRPDVAKHFLWIGATLAIMGYGAGAAATYLAEQTAWWSWEWAIVSIEPHADAPFEMLGNIGIALIVTSTCILITRINVIRVLATPLAAVGSMALTMYIVQAITVKALGPEVMDEPSSNLPLLLTYGIGMLTAWAWQRFLGQGPLELTMSRISNAAANRTRSPRGVQR